jgi:hypothetical protein
MDDHRSWWVRHKALVEFIALTIVWPAAIYAAAFWALDWGTYDFHPAAVVALPVAGMLAWAWRNH